MEKVNKMGAFLVDILKMNQPGKGNARLIQELISLSAGKRGAVRNYYIHKMIVLMTVLAAGVILSLICFFFYEDTGGAQIQILHRPGYGEGDRTEELELQIEGQTKLQLLDVTVQERKYTVQEKKQMIDRAIDTLDQILQGENASLDEVRSSLVLPESLENGKVTISWMTVPYGIIGEDGTVLGSEDENGTLVEIQGTLNCAGEEALYSVHVKVFPPKLSEDEALYQKIRREVELADARESHGETLKLPERVEGVQLKWKTVSENPFLTILALTGLALACIYVQMDNRVHDRAEERKKQLLLEYPDFMWKMTMLLGAGLSIKGAFTRISGEYLREKSQKKGKSGGGKFCFVYEEITYTCFEMQSGIPEAQAYERFGKRCQLPEYIRIGSVLSQNLKKGTKGLTNLLEMEAETSLNERKSQARKIGERAGTKLLFPMILMLGVVFAILMIPAFISF